MQTFCTELHSDPASDTTASHAGQKRRKGGSNPATGAHNTPLDPTSKQQSADSTQTTSIDGHPATAQQPSSSESADTLQDISWIDNLAEAYAADPYFADDEKTAA